MCTGLNAHGNGTVTTQNSQQCVRITERALRTVPRLQIQVYYLNARHHAHMSICPVNATTIVRQAELQAVAA